MSQDLSSIEQELERKLEGSLREIDLGPIPLRKSAKSSSLPAVVVLIGIFLLILLFTFFRFIGSIFGGNTNTGNSTQVPILEKLEEFSNKPFIDIAGTAGSNVPVMLVLNGEESVQATTDESGDFTFKKVVLNEGENTIVVGVIENGAIATDKESKPITITLDTVAPALTFTQEATAPTEVYTLKGQTDGDELYVNGTFMSQRNPDGTFEAKLTLVDGANSFEIKAVDKAGNETMKTFVITFSGEKGTATPEKTATQKTETPKPSNTPVASTATPKPATKVPATATMNYYVVTPKAE